MDSSTVKSFTAYFETWIKQVENYLQQLVSNKQIDNQVMVDALISHHKNYYSVKWAGIEDDVLTFFTPPWLNSLELAFLWITGWRPLAAIQLVISLKSSRTPVTSLTQLTEDQVQSIEKLRLRIKSEENKVERELERQQVLLGNQKMVKLSKFVCRVKQRGGNEMEINRMNTSIELAVKELNTGLVRVVKLADYVRLKTLKGLSEILTPKQGVDFLAVFATLQLQVRRVGSKTSTVEIDKN